MSGPRGRIGEAPRRVCRQCGDDRTGEVARRRALLSADAERTMRFLQRAFEPLRGSWTAALDPRDVDALLDEGAAVAVDALGVPR